MMYLFFVLGRVLLGGYFIMSGHSHFKNLKMLTGYAKSKNLPMPGEMVILTGIMMVLGGLGILLGVFQAFSIFLLVLFLLVTTLKMHQFWTETDPATRMSEMVNFTKNMALIGALLMLLAIPLPWAFSLVV
jgi:putative oxidoreductase